MISRPLRFCMVTTFYPPYSFGGDAVYVHRLANELAQRGHQVDIIHSVDAYRLLARREPGRQYADHPNVTVRALRSRWGWLSPLATQQLGFPLFERARIRGILSGGYDVIHYHNISLAGGPGVLAYGQGVKLYTLHEYWLVCATHVLFRYGRAPCTHPHCLLCSLAYKRPPQWWRYTGLLRTSLQHVDAFLAPGRWTWEVHRQRRLELPIVSLPFFAPAATEGPGEARYDAPYFLFAGRLERLKGLQTLIPLFRRYRRAQLLVAGRGSYEPVLRRLAAGSANIRFLGLMSQAQLQALYRQAIAVIVPSLCLETGPLVPFEALAQGTPVIVRRLGGMPDVVTESGGGLIYDTEEELAAAMDRLLDDRALRDDLGRRGYEKGRGDWSADAHLERYLGLIEGIRSAKSQ